VIATAAAAPFSSPLSLPNPCNWGPVGYLCQAAKTAGSVASGVGGFVGGVWNILSDPVGAITSGVRSFMSAAADAMSTSTAIHIDQKATLLIYGMVAAISFFLSLIVMVRNIGFRRNLAAQIWAVPGYLLYVASLVAVPIGLTVLNEMVDLAVTPFTTVAGSGFNALFTFMEKINGGNLGAYGPANGLLAQIIVAVIYLIAAILLWLELVLRAGIILTMLVLYPIFALGLIDPSRSGVVQTAGRLRLQRYFDVLVAIFVVKWVIAVVLALAGALVAYGGASGALTALGLVVLVVFVPFGLFAFLPVAEAAAIGAGLSKAATAPLRGASRAAKGAASASTATAS
jgi:hypothetical protein